MGAPNLSGCEILIAGLDDAEAVRALLRAAFGPSAEQQLGCSIESLLASDEDTILLARAESAAGCVILSRLERKVCLHALPPPSGPEGEHVVADLIREALAWTTRHGLAPVLAVVEPDATGVEALLAAVGFLDFNHAKIRGHRLLIHQSPDA